MDPKTPQPQGGRVLQFRPRARAPGRDRGWSPVDDLRRYARAGDDDFGHRMMMNLLAAAVVVVLVGCGIWLVDVIAQTRKNQDCVLSGRRNCVQIDAPINAR
jgi:hypothetical protein